MAFPLAIVRRRGSRQLLSSAAPFETNQDMFCVECGAEGVTYRGLCARCFTKKNPVVEPPPVLDMARCASCGSYRLRSGWSKVDRDLVLPQLLREAIPARPPYQRLSFTHVAREEDANNLAVTVKALGRFEDLSLVQDFRVRVRIKPSLYESCQKQRSRYYEGILQVRGDGRNLAPKEIGAVQTFVAARVDRMEDPDAFLSRTEQVHGGLDFYVSTNALGRRLARDVAETFGGAVSASPKLYGQKEGREVYRVTSLVRLGAFRTGDVVRHKGGLAEVTSVRPFVVLKDLLSGEARRFKPTEARGAKRVDAERFEAVIERLDSGETVAVHPESGESRPVRPPPRAGVARAVVVWTPEGAYLSSFPAESSKD